MIGKNPYILNIVFGIIILVASHGENLSGISIWYTMQ